MSCNIESIHGEGRINHAQTLSGSVIMPMIEDRADIDGTPTGPIGRNHHKSHIHQTESQNNAKSASGRRKTGEIFKSDQRYPGKVFFMKSKDGLQLEEESQAFAKQKFKESTLKMDPNIIDENEELF